MHGRLNGVTIHVFSRDAALDKGDRLALDRLLDKANESGDFAPLPLRDGRAPVKWRLMSLSERAYADFTRTAQMEVFMRMNAGKHALIDQAAYTTRREAVRRGLVGAEGAVDDRGQPLELKHEDSPSGRVLTPESLEALYKHYGPNLIGELGQRIIDLSELDPT